jgi:hypothetical protein
MFIYSLTMDGRNCVDSFPASYLTTEIYPVSETLKTTDVHTNSYLSGRAIAQAVKHRLPTAVAAVRPQVRSCEICG